MTATVGAAASISASIFSGVILVEEIVVLTGPEVEALLLAFGGNKTDCFGSQSELVINTSASCSVTIRTCCPAVIKGKAVLRADHSAGALDRLRYATPTWSRSP